MDRCIDSVDQHEMLQNTYLMSLQCYLNAKGLRGHSEHGGSVVECLTRDRGAVGLSLTGVTVLCS